jgi:Flp pilus assembly secretin CpaC
MLLKKRCDTGAVMREMKFRAALRHVLILGLTIPILVSSASAQKAGTDGAALLDATQVGSAVHLTMDHSTLMRLPPNIATLIVGNPMIADATVNRTGLMVLTGKGFGNTNLIGLDASGKRVLEMTMDVRPQTTNTVQVYRGPDSRNTYSCVPNCTPTVAIGDESKFYGSTIEQTMMRSEAANGQYVSSKSSEAMRVPGPPQ